MNQQNGRSGSQVKAKLEQVDRFQREHRTVAVPVAVVRKFAEDRSPQLASMIAFWAFFSIFPLFLVFVTLLGFFLPPNLRNDVLTTVGSMFPLIDPTSVQGLTGSWWALILGLVTALWSGMRAVRVTQFAFNSVWELPYKDRPKFVEQIGRSLGVLVTIGLGLVLTTLVTGFVAGAAGALGLSWSGHLLGYAVAVVLDVGLFVAAFRILTNREITTRDVLPGAVLSGLLFFVLQSLSSLIISRYLHNAQRTYGQFATVITLLWWFYLQSIVTLLGAQLNVVLKEHLHPRALAASLDTEADERAYRAYAQERAYHDDEHIRTEFRDKR
ncbi:YihY/virulence factor BrkB family protein [Amycolatopsis cynarae]|uniref:YihY/virulence factor BrkB family protein n=1 Tax=Amycolatopsis cynarae TaxID=2995223 RepID=A0ABY7AYV4_9PSEU|nr:YihY/virulence factor BrkB family protein [Amycolatopsis sp. HUAS 11-8]WAL65190.1 YihY/virulence factor BrkB family protein [Amycolatopsis sp. HUAS 11-8]